MSFLATTNGLRPLAGSPLVALVKVLRIVMTIQWACVFVRLLPAMRRTPGNRAEAHDDFHFLFWCMSVIMISFGIRWLLFPQTQTAMQTAELVLWSTTYTLSAALGRRVYLQVRSHGR